MGLYRDESGRVIEIDDGFAEARGYEALGAAGEAGLYAERGEADRVDEMSGGVAGAARAGASRFLSGATVGLTDVLHGAVMTPGEREQLLGDIDAHPYVSAGGEVAGALAGALAMPGSAMARTPAGYLSATAQRGVEAGLAAGGVKGTAKALGYMGAEGAVQSAGQYIGHASLADKEVTAEGLTGALGTGFAFGAAGGGAALGVVNGVMAGRRLYSRVMGGKKAAAAAESSWTIAAQESLDADLSTARTLEVEVENTFKAKTAALRGRNEARSAAQEASLDAQGMRVAKEPGDFEMSVKTDVVPEGVDFEAGIPTSKIPELKPEAAPTGMPTSVFKRPGELEGPSPLIDVGSQPSGAATSVFKRPAPATIGPATKADVTDGMRSKVDAKELLARGVDQPPGVGADKVKMDKARAAIKEGQKEPIKIGVDSQGKLVLEDGRHRLAAAAEAGKKVEVQWYRGVDVEKPAGDLEAQLAGTKEKLDGGTRWKDIQGDPTKPPRKFNEEDPLDLDDVGVEMLGEARRGGRTKESLLKAAADARSRTQQTLSEIRYKATEDLLGPQIAKREQEVADAMDEFKAARKDFEELAARVDDRMAFDDGPIAVRDTDGFPPTRDGGGLADPQKTAAGSPGNRKAIEILDDAHEEALLRVKHAADPQEAGQALTEAQELENLLEDLMTPRLHAPDAPMSRGELRGPQAKQWSDELMEAAAKVRRYEEASAKMTELAGEGAHPVSIEKTASWRAAEKDAERKMYDRTARATDDAADGIHPKVSAAKTAKKAQLEAQRKLDETSAQHTEAKHDFSVASKKARGGEKAKKDALREDAKLARVGGGIGAQDAGGIMELIDIPGMPKPSDLPFIGPLLGAYLKFRTIKKAMGGAMGRVPATADARVAALAAQTRDRVARAVDRSIGAMARGAKTMTKVMPAITGVLTHRIFDDGLADEKKGANIQDLAAARVRELAAYVHTPGAIERDVRVQLAEVTDPDLIAAAEAQRRMAMEYLLSVAPKMPEPNLLNPIKYRPAPAQAMSFARSMEAIGDPAGVFERLEHEQAMISLEAAEALRKVYPRIFSEAGMRLMERAQEGGLKVPMRKRVQLTLLYKVPLDSALDPDNLKITQSVYDRKVMQPAPGMQGVPAQPSIANPVNLSQGLTPAADRRSP